MLSFWKIRSLPLAMGFVIMLTIFIGFDFSSPASPGAFSKPQQTQIASMNRVDAITKSIEGQIQETI